MGTFRTRVIGEHFKGLHDHINGTWHPDIPVVIIGPATYDEWVAQFPSLSNAEKGAARGATFWRASID